MSESITRAAVRHELTLPTLVAGAGAAAAHWLALRHGAAHPSGVSFGFWLALFGPCVFSLWLSIEQVWHRASVGVVTQWVIRQFIMVPSLIVLTALFGVLAVGGAADTGHAVSPDESGSATGWLIENLAIGALINLAIGLLVSIAGLLLVLLPASVLLERRRILAENPNMTAAQLRGFTMAGLGFIAMVAMAFVVPTLLVVANGQSGTTQVVLRVVGIGLGVATVAGAFVLRSIKQRSTQLHG